MFLLIYFFLSYRVLVMLYRFQFHFIETYSRDLKFQSTKSYGKLYRVDSLPLRKTYNNS